MKTIDDLDVAGARVLVRADLNVPMDGTRITDDGRIRASLPTLQALLARSAKVVVCAHLGRPEGKPDPRYSLAPVARRLGERLGCQIMLAADTVGPDAHAAVATLRPGEVVLLENLRFNPGETSKDDAQRWEFAGRLAALADTYVSDGFGILHRKHASVYDVAMRLPHAAGYLVLAETAALDRLARNIRRPYVVVLDGAKVADKVPVVANLLQQADLILIGGAMSFTFLAAQGYQVGTSLTAPDLTGTVGGYLDQAGRGGAQIVLPTDVVVAASLSPGEPHTVAPASRIPADQMGLDIGPETARQFATMLAGAKTIFWNGPMGVAELAAYADGTRTVARAIIDSDAYSVVGGGDTTATARALGFADSAFGHVSTGGGASLEYMKGKILPGLAVLRDNATIRA